MRGTMLYTPGDVRVAGSFAASDNTLRDLPRRLPDLLRPP